jgi:hypothetical protein
MGEYADELLDSIEHDMYESDFTSIPFNKKKWQVKKRYIWVTKDGEHLEAKKMKTSHIKNVILFLERKQQTKDTKEWIDMFNNELKVRGEKE